AANRASSLTSATMRRSGLPSWLARHALWTRADVGSSCIADLSFWGGVGMVLIAGSEATRYPSSPAAVRPTTEKPGRRQWTFERKSASEIHAQDLFAGMAEL